MTDPVELCTRVGFLTWQQADAVGIRTRQLTTLVARGELRRGVRGVYLPGAANTPERDLVANTRALLSLDPWAVASHQSALALHGVPLFDTRTDRVHLAGPRHGSRVGGRVHHHVLRDGEPTLLVDGVRAVGVPVACVQVAARSGLEAGVVAMDAALNRGLCTKEELHELVASGRVRRGLVAAREAVSFADGRAESPGESRLRLALRGSPWPVETQVNVGGPGAGFRVDLLVAGLVALEFDGDMKYGEADGREALIAEKTREDFLRRRFEVVRVRWNQLGFPIALKREVHDAVVRSRARRAAA